MFDSMGPDNSAGPYAPKPKRKKPRASLGETRAAETGREGKAINKRKADADAGFQADVGKRRGPKEAKSDRRSSSWLAAALSGKKDSHAQTGKRKFSMS